MTLATLKRCSEYGSESAKHDWQDDAAYSFSNAHNIRIHSASSVVEFVVMPAYLGRKQTPSPMPVHDELVNGQLGLDTALSFVYG